MNDVKAKSEDTVGFFNPATCKEGTLWLRPMPVSKQWKRIANWHSSDSESPSAELNEAWHQLEALYGINLIQRGEKLRNLSDSPLATLFFLVEMGFYPPPELLLGLRDCWNSYLSGLGEVSLEMAFLGASPPNAGNASRRKSAEMRRAYISVQLNKLISEGLRPIDAAEEVSRTVGGKPDAESILRMHRRRTKSKKKPEK